MEFFDFPAMNTRIVFAAEGEATRVQQGFACARVCVERYAAQFTRFQESSELSQLNRASGAWFNASPELFDLLQHAQALYLETQGLFNPAILDALERMGYDASMEVVRARTGVSSSTSRAAALPANFDAIGMHAAQRAVWLPEGMRVDLGGIAKGWIVERAARVLAQYTRACAVNAGGDLFAIGLPANAMAWEIELEDPRDAERTLALLRVPPGAVATSSVTKRKWQQGAHERHHLIDPRTGLPAVTDWLSVTVFALRATVAEVFAKALLIAGSREAMQLAAARAEIQFIAVDRDGTLWGSAQAGEFLNERMESV